MDWPTFREPKRKTGGASWVIRITLKDLSTEKRLANLRNLYFLFLPLLVGMEGKEEFAFLDLLTDKLGCDLDEASSSATISG